MKASNYWSMLNGFWTLFKGRDTFTALWDSMIKSCQEYASIYNHVCTGGIMDAEESLALTWEKINIGEDYVVSIIDDDGNDKGYDIVSISDIITGVGGTSYVDNVDYTFNAETKVITWISEPATFTGEFLSEELHVNTGIIDSFYNSGLYNLDLSVYDNPKWVLYACIKHMGFLQTPDRMKNIISILSGSPFSRYYGEFSVSGGYCYINYAVDVSTDHEMFLKKNELDGYCYIDEQTGELYDERYPDDGVTLVLCHKKNIIKTGDRYSIVLRSENYQYDGLITPYSSGELVPINMDVDIEEGSIDRQYSEKAIPLYNVVSGDDNETTASYDYAIYSGVIQPFMTLRYTDNVEVPASSVTVISSSEIKVIDPIVHLFLTQEDIILTDVSSGVSKYCNIKAGYYNESDNTYMLELTATLIASHSYKLYVPVIRNSMCPVTEVDDSPGDIIVHYNVSSSQMPVLMQSPIGSSYPRMLYIESGTSGESILTLENSSGTVSAGDTIVVTSGGEQDYYTAIAVNGLDITVSPVLRRSYSANAAYNIQKSLDVGRVRVTGNSVGVNFMPNIEAYMGIWMPGIIPCFAYTAGDCPSPALSIEYIDDSVVITITPETDGDTIYYTMDGEDPDMDEMSTYEDKNLDNPILRDQRYWQRMDQEAIKEIKE